MATRSLVVNGISTDFVEESGSLPCDFKAFAPLGDRVAKAHDGPGLEMKVLIPVHGSKMSPRALPQPLPMPLGTARFAGGKA